MTFASEYAEAAKRARHANVWSANPHLQSAIASKKRTKSGVQFTFTDGSKAMADMLHRKVYELPQRRQDKACATFVICSTETIARFLGRQVFEERLKPIYPNATACLEAWRKQPLPAIGRYFPWRVDFDYSTGLVIEPTRRLDREEA